MEHCFLPSFSNKKIFTFSDKLLLDKTIFNNNWVFDIRFDRDLVAYEQKVKEQIKEFNNLLYEDQENTDPHAIKYKYLLALKPIF